MKNIWRKWGKRSYLKNSRFEFHIIFYNYYWFVGVMIIFYYRLHFSVLCFCVQVRILPVRQFRSPCFDKILHLQNTSQKRYSQSSISAKSSEQKLSWLAILVQIRFSTYNFSTFQLYKSKMYSVETVLQSLNLDLFPG